MVSVNGGEGVVASGKWRGRLTLDRYDKRHFAQFQIEHVDMYFDDGGNPTDEIVRDFIKMADEIIEVRKQKVAVHCKAGLGRTGVLIGGELTCPRRRCVIRVDELT